MSPARSPAKLRRSGLRAGSSRESFRHFYMELNIGDPAPYFQAIAVGGIYGSGQPVKLSDFKGSTLVLYFYPKDDSLGCTKQACDLRDTWGEIQSKAELFGISVDSAESHAKFIKKNGLPFPLLSDAEKQIVQSYGVWVEKSMYGKKYFGTERTTFVIGADQRITHILKKVKPAEHATLLAKALLSGAQV
jgi:thioredoxin-dependent peroxiredoxin